MIFNENVGIIVQARMASSRLPNKVLMSMPFGSKETILSQICMQLKYLEAKLIIATSKNSENDRIESFCLSNDIICFRGDEDDVYSRFYEIQKKYQFEHIFRFTGDNPLIDIKKLKEFFQKYLNLDLDYAQSRGMPLGMNYEVFKGCLLKTLPYNKFTNRDKEHVTLYIKSNLVKNKKYIIELSDHSKYRMTVDTAADYAQLSFVFQLKELLRLEGLQLLNEIRNNYDWILSLNSGVLQKNNFERSSDEIEALANFADNLGYDKAVKKLLK